jgi:hypothetical protein
MAANKQRNNQVQPGAGVWAHPSEIRKLALANLQQTRSPSECNHTVVSHATLALQHTPHIRKKSKYVAGAQRCYTPGTENSMPKTTLEDVGYKKLFAASIYKSSISGRSPPTEKPGWWKLFFGMDETQFAYLTVVAPFGCFSLLYGIHFVCKVLPKYRDVPKTERLLHFSLRWAGLLAVVCAPCTQLRPADVNFMC